MKTINLEKEKMITLTGKEFNKKKIVTFAKQSLKINTLQIKMIVKLGKIVIIKLNTEVLDIAYVI